MSQNPRRVLTTTTVAWPPGMGTSTVVREGSLVDIPPSNAAMIAAYGGAGNLQTPTAAQLGNAAVADKSALTN